MTSRGGSFFERTRWAWHTTSVGIAGVVALAAALAGHWYAAAACAVLIAAYAVLGVRALREDSGKSSWAAAGYLPIAYAAFVVAVLQDDAGYILLFLLYPHTFSMLRRRWTAVALCAVLSSCLGIAVWHGNSANSDAWVSGAVSGAVNFVVACLLGLFIAGVADESRKRALLIAELESTRAELASAHHREGVLAERERLSREIHDTLAQGFTSVVMLSRVATRALRSGDDALALDRLKAIEDVGRDNLAEARALVAALAPAPLLGASLPEAVDRLVARFRSETGTPTAYVVAGDPRPLPSPAQVALLRAAQESLANVRKHSGAGEVEVQLRYDEERVCLRIRDDGCGFDPDAVAESGGSSGFGLVGMRGRLSAVEGSLRLVTAPGGGTEVSIEVAAPQDLPAAAFPAQAPASMGS